MGHNSLWLFCPSTDRLGSGEPPEVSPGPSSRVTNIPTARSKTVGKAIIARLNQKSTKKFEKAIKIRFYRLIIDEIMLKTKFRILKN